MLDGDPVPPPKKGAESPSPIFGPCLLCRNGWMDQDGTWHGDGPWSRPHCGRWGPSSPPQKGGRAPMFVPILLWPNGWMHQDATWCGNRPQPRRLCVRWRPSRLPKKGRSPLIFGPRLLCQTAAWIKMPLGTEVGLGLRDIVLSGDPVSLPYRCTPPYFRPMSIVAKRLDGLRCHLVWRQASAQATLCSMGTQLPQKKAPHPPPANFWPMSVVAKQLDR